MSASVAQGDALGASPCDRARPAAPVAVTAPDVDLQRNAKATRRLRELVALLWPDDLRRSLGGGWTVAVALTHLTFWDTRQDAALRSYTRGAAFPSEDGDDLISAALEAIARLVDPDAVAAVQAAEQVGAAVMGLTPDQRAELIAAEHGYSVRRWGHREEHLEQIEAALE